ncbi:hypothetical protein L210DRAFT_3570253 [Boletus edulis BED1]|uniref:Uncharacterized protein n=1 Tax=Boletus edulis BED1 TaxID=1328754 RepID=A0AAD4BEF3_BOLED|nr:hypothetical protein L210DRAFT_3570253 [Boletus edulis BED1]
MVPIRRELRGGRTVAIKASVDAAVGGGNGYTIVIVRGRRLSAHRQRRQLRVGNASSYRCTKLFPPFHLPCLMMIWMVWPSGAGATTYPLIRRTRRARGGGCCALIRSCAQNAGFVLFMVQNTLLCRFVS